MARNLTYNYEYNFVKYKAKLKRYVIFICLFILMFVFNSMLLTSSNILRWNKLLFYNNRKCNALLCCIFYKKRR